MEGLHDVCYGYEDCMKELEPMRKCGSFGGVFIGKRERDQGLVVGVW